MPTDTTLTGRPPRSLLAAIAALHLFGLALLVLGTARGASWFGMGGLAYLLGLRHAFDIDHVAVIDNVTRALIAERRSASFAGFAFSLGHSTVVFGLCVITVMSSSVLTDRFDTVAAVGDIVGTVVSATFLSLVVLFNGRLVWRLWQSRPTGDPNHSHFGGPLAGWISRRTTWIDKAWKMALLGFVFGLGFDTATEIALLALSASAVHPADVDIGSIMALPLLFAAGMTTLDSVNGLVMQRAYRWGTRGTGRFGFNLIVTTLSVAVAGVVAVVEWTGLVTDHLAPASKLAAWIAALPGAAFGFVVFLGCLTIWWIARYRCRSNTAASSG